MDCIFCRLVEGTIPSERVFESGSVIAFRDISPQAPVHVVLIPKKHISTLNDIQPGDQDMIAELMAAAIEVARIEGISQSGYRFVINTNEDGGQTVFHLHAHLMGKRKFLWPPG